MDSDDPFLQPLVLASASAGCPWCGEVQEWVVDPSNITTYVEDCFVCCRPCLIQIVCDAQGQVQRVQIERE